MMKKINSLIISSILFLTGFQTFAQTLTFHDFRPLRDSLQQNNAINNYNIGAEKDLYILLSQKFSLQHELAKLAPNLNQKELTTKGNYSFTFLIDGKVAYTENLHPGAILLPDKITNKSLDIVFISNGRSGLWSINMWDRFIGKIGTSVFNEKQKLLTIQIKVYIDNKGIVYSPIITENSISIVKIQKPLDPALYQPQKIAANSGFEITTQPTHKNLITQLNMKVADKTYRKINGIVALKKGKLVVEQYYNGENRETLHDPRSVSKSVTGTLIGMAIDDGFIKTTQQTIGEFYQLNEFKNFSIKKNSVKLADLLTMSSAFDGNDEISSSPGNEENMYPTDDYVKFTLNLPMDTVRENGKKWAYFTAGTMLLGDILDKSIPGGLEAYAKRKLFDPLHIGAYEWARTPQGKPFGGGGLRLRALDFAKYGLLYSNGGSFEKKQLISKSWITQSFFQHQTLPADRPGYYGYLFWNKTFKVNNKAYEAYYSTGNGGNKIYVFKNTPIVIVITASAYGTSYAHTQADEIVEKYLLPAML
jgi:CubicO group peptidase (beta-lactamase class C family)